MMQMPLPEDALTAEQIARQRARLSKAKVFWATRPRHTWPSWVYDLMGVPVTKPTRRLPADHSKPYRLSWRGMSLK